MSVDEMPTAKNRFFETPEKIEDPRVGPRLGSTNRVSFLLNDYSGVMSDDVIPYRSCLTCGRLMPLQAGSKQVYCSPECSRENLRCSVCGRYFEKGTGTVQPDGQELCSADCALVDHRYDSLFKELT